MRRFFRRKKKLIIRLSIAIAIIAFVLLLIIYVLPKDAIKSLTTSDSDENNSSPELEVTVIEGPTITVSLPEVITTVNEVSDDILNQTTDTIVTDGLVTSVVGANGKTYTSYVDDGDKYFITILSSDNTALTIMLSNKAKELLTKNSASEIGVEYEVSGISESIVGVYDFTYSNYKYPILLLLSSSGNLYYIDLEEAIESGQYKVKGPIKDVSKVCVICKVEVTTSDSTYKTAVISDIDNIGYEFTLDMIGR